MLSQKIHLIKSDWKLIGRDPMLIMALIAPVLILGVSVLLLPIISNLLSSMLNFDLEPYMLIIRVFLLPLTPMMLGLIYGFILLDERDGGIISYLSITPVGKEGYLLIRLSVPVLVSFVMCITFSVVSGFLAFVSLFEILTLSFILSLEAPLMLLFLGSFAGNKVEGIALSKFFGVFMFPIILDFFTTGNWRWVLSASPLWWIGRVFIGNPELRWIYLAGALLIHLFLVALLYRKFQNKLG
jgi:fluoroquinolone transport system permease protein